MFRGEIMLNLFPRLFRKVGLAALIAVALTLLLAGLTYAGGWLQAAQSLSGIKAYEFHKVAFCIQISTFDSRSMNC